MNTKKIYYKNKGMDNEDYIFLDYDSETEIFSIREGFSHQQSDSLIWDGAEEIYTVEEFKEKHPEFMEKTDQLILEIKNENTKKIE